MALQTANQFNLTPNATGAFNQGIEQGAKLKNQFITEPKLQQLTKAAANGDKQALIDLQAMSPERANQFQQFKGNEQSLESGAQNMERKKLEDRTRSVINGALEVQQIQDPKAKLMALKKRKIQLLDEGKETQDTDEAITLYEAGDIEGGNALIDNVVELGVRHGIINPKQQGKGFSLSAGQTRFDSQGNEIASVERGSQISSDAAGFEDLISDFSEEDKVTARKIKAGLKGRAISNAELTAIETGDIKDYSDYKVKQKQAEKFAEATGAQRSKLIDAGFEKISKITSGIRTGAIEKLWPSIKASSVLLDNIRGDMALDVVGATTFGALSKGELDLAKDIALPTGLDDQELKTYLTDKKSAQEKLKAYYNEQIQFLDQGGTIAGFLRKKEQAPVSTNADNGGSNMDSQAMQWAKDNPNDPRAAQIMQKLGGS